MSKHKSNRNRFYYKNQLKRIVEILKNNESCRDIVFGSEIPGIIITLSNLREPRMRDENYVLLKEFVEIRNTKKFNILMTYAGRYDRFSERQKNSMLYFQKKANAFMNKNENVRYIDLNL